MNINPKCPYCGAWSDKVTGTKIYPHRPDLRNHSFYLCVPCDAYVGCHAGTDTPLGRLANKSLREAKKKAHAVFDPLWRGGALSRKQAYAWLAEQMGIPVHECHIGAFDEVSCHKVIEIMKHEEKLEAAYWEFEARIDLTQHQYPTMERVMAFKQTVNNLLGAPIAYCWFSSKWQCMEVHMADDLPANAPSDKIPLYRLGDRM